MEICIHPSPKTNMSLLPPEFWGSEPTTGDDIQVYVLANKSTFNFD